MKTKATLLIVCAAVVTLSFTFSLKKNEKSITKQPSEKTVVEDQIGGTGSEDKF